MLLVREWEQDLNGMGLKQLLNLETSLNTLFKWELFKSEFREIRQIQEMITQEIASRIKST